MQKGDTFWELVWMTRVVSEISWQKRSLVRTVIFFQNLRLYLHSTACIKIDRKSVIDYFPRKTFLKITKFALNGTVGDFPSLWVFIRFSSACFKLCTLLFITNGKNWVSFFQVPVLFRTWKKMYFSVVFVYSSSSLEK